MGDGCNLVDLGENVMLARKKILQQFPWDPQLTNAEHEDFYLNLKFHKANVASCSWFKYQNMDIAGKMKSLTFVSINHLRPALSAYPGYVEDRSLYANQLRLCLKYSLRGFDILLLCWAEG